MIGCVFLCTSMLRRQLSRCVMNNEKENVYCVCVFDFGRKFQTSSSSSHTVLFFFYGALERVKYEMMENILSIPRDSHRQNAHGKMKC